jgi:FkbM family methyltransferase
VTTFDEAADALAAVQDEVTLLQVGAFDGITNDPALGALRRHGWRGVLVEPQARPFAALRELHAGDDRVQVLNVAVSDVDGTRELFTLDPVDDLPGWAQQIASFERSHLVGQQRYLPDGVVAERLSVVDVETVTFDTLLARAGVDRVDVLQIDTEGFDHQVLRMFDVPRRLPAIVNFESIHLADEDKLGCADLLESAGYALTVSHWDTLGVRLPP